MNQASDALTHWTIGSAAYVIQRFVADATGSLRGWDTADEYLLRAATDIKSSPRHWLILNDDFGALTTAVCGLLPDQGEKSALPIIHVVQDTSLGREAIARNLQHNHPSPSMANVVIHEHLDAVVTDAPMDVMLAKIPKTNAVLDAQLRALRSGLVDHHTNLFLSGMVKHLSPGTQTLLETHLGATQRHLAVRKARLFQTKFDASLTPPVARYPRRQDLPELNLTINAAAGVFASEKPDPATLYLSQHIPTLEAGGSIMDLGCGSAFSELLLHKKIPLLRFSSLTPRQPLCVALSKMHLPRSTPLG